MNNKPLRFSVVRQWNDFGFDIRAAYREPTPSSVIAVAQPVEFKTVPVGSLMQSMLSLTEEDCRALMDELWAAGIRPSNGEGSVGVVAALKHHLDDMRTVAFHKVGIKETP